MNVRAGHGGMSYKIKREEQSSLLPMHHIKDGVILHGTKRVALLARGAWAVLNRATIIILRFTSF